jgi:hypothetical protein
LRLQFLEDANEAMQQNQQLLSFFGKRGIMGKMGLSGLWVNSQLARWGFILFSPNGPKSQQTLILFIGDFI